MNDEKWEKRLDTLIKLLDVIEQGSAHISWQDKSIVKIEKIETEKSIITK